MAYKPPSVTRRRVHFKWIDKNHLLLTTPYKQKTVAIPQGKYVLIDLVELKIIPKKDKIKIPFYAETSYDLGEITVYAVTDQQGYSRIQDVNHPNDIWVEVITTDSK